mmetsp:Transcript_68367/g.216341  ORF Transcript_68367/g.216341 Transcript_68367/m.216341 type:complete len:359 (-) Transcript_68367:545-1621(-)
MWTTIAQRLSRHRRSTASSTSILPWYCDMVPHGGVHGESSGMPPPSWLRGVRSPDADASEPRRPSSEDPARSGEPSGDLKLLEGVRKPWGCVPRPSLASTLSSRSSSWGSKSGVATGLMTVCRMPSLSTTSVMPSETSTTLRRPLSSTSNTAGSALTTSLSPGLPKARETARSPRTWSNSTTCSAEVPACRARDCRRSFSPGTPGRWSSVRWVMRSSQLPPSPQITTARLSPTLATTNFPGRKRASTAVDPRISFPRGAVMRSSSLAKTRLITSLGHVCRSPSAKMAMERVLARSSATSSPPWPSKTTNAMVCPSSLMCALQRSSILVRGPCEAPTSNHMVYSKNLKATWGSTLCVTP